jgi:superfamily I DNA/RNA helicase
MIASMLNLEAGAFIDGADWKVIVDRIKVVMDGETMLTKGTKSKFDKLSADDALEQYSWVTLSTLEDVGATKALQEAIRSKSWRRWVEGVDTYAYAVQQWGIEAVSKPGIRVGTVHSAKGMEADSVVILTTLSGKCYRAALDDPNQEARVKYVAVTRARRRLIILKEPSTQFRWRLP